MDYLWFYKNIYIPALFKRRYKTKNLGYSNATGIVRYNTYIQLPIQQALYSVVCFLNSICVALSYS